MAGGSVRQSISLVLLLALTATCAAAPMKDDAAPVYPTGAAAPVDPDIKNLTWNRYTTKNFTILSTDDEQGKFLADNIEKIKSWIYLRWGLPDQDFAKECRVLCVPNRTMFKKLFGIDDPKVEFRDNLAVMWLVLDDKPSRTVPNALTDVCLAEYEKKANVKIAWWSRRGMARLNGHLGDVRADMGFLNATLAADQGMFWSKSLMDMTQAQYAKMKPDQQVLYDRQAEAMCLLVRKEFGQVRFHSLITSTDTPEVSVQKILGFRDCDHLDKSYKRYMTDLSGDVLRSRTPDTYLDIRPIKE